MQKKIVINVIFLILIYITAGYSFAEEKKCKQDVIISNSTGTLAFGRLSRRPPGEKQDGVWFPVAPRTIAIDSKDNIYIGDSVNYRVMKFNSSGSFLFEIKLQPPIKVMKPVPSHIIHHIEIDKDDNVYVWNYFEDRVEIYNHNGKFMESVGAGKRLKKMLAKIEKEKNNQYSYEFDSYIPDKKLPGQILYVITVSTGHNRDKKVVAKCGGVELAFDEDGLIYSSDNKGNIYTFDYYKTQNVININVKKINPFK